MEGEVAEGVESNKMWNITSVNNYCSQTSVFST